MRQFETGATRDSEENKFDYEGFFSPLVLQERAAYMHRNRFQVDGNVRDADNWQKGIPLDVYMKSLMRHVMQIWLLHREKDLNLDEMKEAICGSMFNHEGYLHELLKMESGK